MSIASEITRISENIAAAYTALDGKGATLPAEGSQNSANLADTIDTISTGGGGSEDFSSFDSLVETAASQVRIKTSGSISFKSMYETGNWIVHESLQSSTGNSWGSVSDYMGAIGWIFHEDLPQDLYVYKYTVFKAPSDATITYGTNSTKVTFAEGSSKWVILATQSASSYLNDSGGGVLALSDTDNFSGSSSVRIKYLKHGYNAMCTDVYTEASPLIVTYNGHFRNYIGTLAGGICPPSRLISFGYTKNVKYDISSVINAYTAVDLGHLPKAMSLENFYNQYIYNDTYQNTVLSSTESVKLFNSSTLKQQACDIEAFPFILDLSDQTPSRWNVGYVDGWGAYGSQLNMHANFLEKTKIKIPDCPINISGGNYEKIMDVEYFNYLATNAPSVSSKTLSISALAKSYYQTVAASAISTLQSKGWTVS